MTSPPIFIPGSILPGKKKEPYHVEHITDVHNPDYMTSEKLDFNGYGFLYRMSTRAINEIEDEIPANEYDPRIKELVHHHKFVTILRHAQKVVDMLDEDLRSGISVAPNEIKPYLIDRKTKLSNLINQRKALLIKCHPNYFTNQLIEIP